MTGHADSFGLQRQTHSEGEQFYLAHLQDCNVIQEGVEQLAHAGVCPVGRTTKKGRGIVKCSGLFAISRWLSTYLLQRYNLLQTGLQYLHFLLCRR